VSDFAALFDFGWVVWLPVACDQFQPRNLTSRNRLSTIGSDGGGVTLDRDQEAARFGLTVRFGLSVASKLSHSKTQRLRR
jgi:hypothetical protein